MLIGNTCYEETHLMLPVNYYAVTDIYERNSVESHCLFTMGIPKSRYLIFFFWSFANFYCMRFINSFKMCFSKRFSVIPLI